ncbi:MAG: hypothetical protein M0R40_01470 [Firmicutes bacterium]|nr:hypothetical protein [Bacillota bacterium]
MKIISVLLIVLKIISSVAFCIDNSADDIAFAVKKKLDIPEYYLNFNSGKEQTANEITYNLSWSGENSQGGGSVSVIADEMGRIIYYNRYEYGNFEGDYKFSTLDYNGAVEIAYDNIKRICPEFAYNIIPIERENYFVRNSDSYQINFIRIENEVPYYDNYIIASVNAKDKILSEFAVRWYDIPHFPKPQGIITKERAKKLFQETGGISEGYYNNNVGKALMLYSRNKPENEYINAFTGEITKTNLTWGRYFLGQTTFVEPADNKLDMQIAPMDTSKAVVFIDNILRRLKIGGAYDLNNAVLFSDSNKSYYSFELAFGEDEFITIEADASTNEISRFYRSGVSENGYVINEQTALKKALDFANIASYEIIDKCADGVIKKVSSENGGYNYRISFARLVEGIPYFDNGITIVVSANDGEILSFKTDWDDEQIFNLPKVTKPDAYDKLFDHFEYNLCYVTVTKSKIKTPNNVRDIDIRLVYDFAPGTPLYISAETGNFCLGDSTNFIKKDCEVYGDIDGHPSYNSIKTLLCAGFLKSAELYYPDENILQAEYLNRLYYAIKNEDLGYNALYAQLSNQGILTEDEITPTEAITLENAIKYAVKLLGFTEVAELSETFKTNFIDESMIKPGLIGYAAIAQGLGIIKGNVFLPKRFVTKALAAEIIYNILMPKEELSI